MNRDRTTEPLSFAGLSVEEAVQAIKDVVERADADDWQKLILAGQAVLEKHGRISRNLIRETLKVGPSMANRLYIALVPPATEQMVLSLPDPPPKPAKVQRSKRRRGRIVEKPTVAGYLYIIRADGDHCKIGVSTRPENRLRALNNGNPHALAFEMIIATPDMFGLERVFHQRFGDKRVKREWFALTPADIDDIRAFLRQQGYFYDETARRWLIAVQPGDVFAR